MRQVVAEVQRFWELFRRRRPAHEALEKYSSDDEPIHPLRVFCGGVRVMNNRRNNVRELREKVDKYRALARMVTDEETRRRILELTDELEQQARDIERRG